MIKYSYAKPEDLYIIKNHLKENKLHNEDIEDHINNFIIAKNGKNIIGSIGLEIYGSVALLRSVAVIEKHRNKGIAETLYTKILNYASDKRIKKLYLLTNTAEKYFSNLGFEKTERNKAPLAISNTKEFKEYCSSESTFMSKNIDLKDGDVITIPSDVPHRVFTKNKSVKAINKQSFSNIKNKN